MAETWILKDSYVNTAPYDDLTFNFTSNDEQFVGTRDGGNGDVFMYVRADNSVVYVISKLSEVQAADWEKYRKITISEPATGDVLTWLTTWAVKQTVLRKSYDLSTSAKWATLTAGNHNVQIVAKASGYRDSEKSAAVVVNKPAATVTLEAGTYKFIESPVISGKVIEQNLNGTFNSMTKAGNTWHLTTGQLFNSISLGRNGATYDLTIFGTSGEVNLIYRDSTKKWIPVHNNVENLSAPVSYYDSFRTITFSTAQQVSADFYKWAITDGNLVKQEPTHNDCITFTGESSDFTLSVGSDGAKEWNGTVEYSTDHNTWTTWDGTAVSSVDKKLYLRGSGNTKFYTKNGAKFVLSARAACSGNIQALLEYSNPPTSIPTSNCYRSMFDGCTNLTAAPELPATTLASSCYRYMFYNCTSLTQAPTLPATTLAEWCYTFMFYNCTSLTQAPTLPATTLAKGCYSNMFYNCTSLTQAPTLPATTLAEWCYTFMFYNCTSLTQAPTLPATTLAKGCYSSMFYNCTSLTQAPALPATTLADSCYKFMFSGCASLKISETQSTEYPTAWRIPSSGTISSEATNWNNNMLSGTGGTFTSDPNINTTYYGAWTK